ncbi:MAG TPA: hypothetical protein DCR55_12755 [Lentisphaeria bacterium]|nr:hypothetical protein [Lentisphaeria bacterium]
MRAVMNNDSLSLKAVTLIVLVGAVAFMISHLSPWLAPLSLIYLWSAGKLSLCSRPRVALRAGFVLGMLVYAVHLRFFWGIFGAGAIALWGIISAWLGLFAAAACLARVSLPRTAFHLSLPILWLACEYTRSELYYLRFSWGAPSYSWHAYPGVAGWIGMYGLSALVLVLLALPRTCGAKGRWALLFLICGTINVAASNPYVAGVQIEFEEEPTILAALDRLYEEHPAVDIAVLPEYTLQGEVPDSILDWCREHGVYLVVGGMVKLEDGYNNTAFVVSPEGAVVHSQGKSVPIQFFNDGFPAKTQQVWNSPWGAIGICICYDMSYTRVTDELIRQGAQALIVPTMDVKEWGEYEHRLHGKVAPIRAAEYRVPIMRVCSSGISQLITADGKVVATASFPGRLETLGGQLEMSDNPRLPLDRYLAIPCLVFGVLIILACYLRRVRPQLLAESNDSQQS